jgi:prepilin-type N-terminal cleavage/methylation domain-containing protein
MKSVCVLKCNLSKTTALPFCSHGFTLIEIIIAIALSALLLSILYWTYFSINKSIETASENQDAMETGRILSEIIKKDIRCINPTGYPIIAKNEEVEDFTLGQIEFVTSTKSSNNQITQKRIGYALKINDSTSKKVLIKRESIDLNNPLKDSDKSFEVSRIIRSFRVEVFNGTDWIAQWSESLTESAPKQVRVIFEILDTKGNSKKYITDEDIKGTS